MRRAWLLLLPSLVALGFACSGATSAPPAALTGAHDLQLVKNMLLVTSSDKDELRVLDLEPSGLPLGTREFLPAPDPIEPLSIPVITRPDQARIVAHLSGEQLCLTQGTAGGACDGGVVP